MHQRLGEVLLHGDLGDAELTCDLPDRVTGQAMQEQRLGDSRGQRIERALEMLQALRGLGPGGGVIAGGELRAREALHPVQ
jgi:hypothetical protein